MKRQKSSCRYFSFWLAQSRLIEDNTAGITSLENRNTGKMDVTIRGSIKDDLSPVIQHVWLSLFITLAMTASLDLFCCENCSTTAVVSIVYSEDGAEGAYHF